MTTDQQRPCTCSSPPPLVDLTDFFFSSSNETNRKHNNEDIASSSCNDPRDVLLQNLSRYGWSHVRIISKNTLSGTNTNSTTSLLQQTPLEWKGRLVSMFPKHEERRSTPGVTYRQAESGAPGTVEPKESLEVQRQRPSQRQQQQLQGILAELLDFTDLLHQVACSVRMALNFPTNVLLDEEEENNCDTAPVDLMRVFYYDTVNASPLTKDDDSPPPVLGSSEHTDWGSLTVVWQDQVGGLQTFCHACEKFHNVTTPRSSKDDDNNDAAWDFVVHVGDLTSICLGLALMKHEKNHTTSESSLSSVAWPSPKHRVVSPTEQRRLSLVYFAYPPACASMQSIQNDLDEWCRTTLSSPVSDSSNSCQILRVPWEDYYLLRDQSSHGQDDNDPRAMYQTIAALPVDAVLQEKWNQVQR
uniref:Fe2OG dioxygenase domain-containing protein n=1 Tax=Amphora coffeiformis TaxID=265554 RepID=A0A7S3L7Y9_9STRA